MSFSIVSHYLVDNASSAQFLLYASILSSMWLFERLVSGETLLEKWRHSSLNGLCVLAALPIQIAMMQPCLEAARLVEGHHWGLIQLLPDAERPWIKYGVMFVLLDLCDYIYHLLMHKIPLFWRFHMLHHTDLRLDVSTTVREHPGETFIRVCFLTVWVLLCGASVDVLIFRQSIESLVNILSHSALRLPVGPGRIIGWLLVTPNFHHVHHHFQRPATNRNYGDVFTVWDRLFGTFLILSREETIFGLDNHPDPLSGLVFAREQAVQESV